MLPQYILGSRSVIINNETEYTEVDLDLIVGVEITGKLPVDCPYESTSLKAAVYAVLICRKENIEDAYRFMIRQLDVLSFQITGAFVEINYDDDTVELKVPVYQLSKSADNIRFDSTDISFVNDPDVIGKWLFLDIVPSKDQFLYDKPKYKDRDNIWLKELYFLPGGEGYWIIHSWTKGSFATSSGDYPKQIFRNYYTILKDNDKTLMFIEMKQYWLEKRGGQPVIYVFEKMSDKELSRAEIQIKDNTDMPFVNDENVIGSWIVRDFVQEPDIFNASKQNWPEDGLFFKKVSFNSNGTATAIYGQKSPYEKTWTKGHLLDVRTSIAPAYHIRNINGKDYLFVEWKSGDYTFGGRKPLWYVFVRE